MFMTPQPFYKSMRASFLQQELRTKYSRTSEKSINHQGSGTETDPSPEVRRAALIRPKSPSTDAHPNPSSFQVQHRTVTTGPLLALVLAHVRRRCSLVTRRSIAH